jgi:hypothetical protein
MEDTAKLKKKYIHWMIIGFMGPFILLTASLILLAVVNLVSAGSTGSVATLYKTILNSLAVVSVFGFVAGPVLGIVGLVRINKLDKLVSPAATKTGNWGNPGQAPDQAPASEVTSNEETKQ